MVGEYGTPGRAFPALRRNTACAIRGSKPCFDELTGWFTGRRAEAACVHPRHRSRRLPWRRSPSLALPPSPSPLALAGADPAAGIAPARHRLLGGRTARPGAAGRIRRDDARQLRHYGYMLDDPLLDELAAVASATGWPPTATSRASPSPSSCCRTGRSTPSPRSAATSASTPAWCWPPTREDEVAGVLAHEIAHVTQHHVLRGGRTRAARPACRSCWRCSARSSSRSRRGGNSSDDAVAWPRSPRPWRLMQQRQIDYTRSNEAEADRVGIQTLVAQRLRPDGDGRLLRPRCSARSRANQRRLRANARPTTCRPTRSPPRASAKPRNAPSRSTTARRPTSPARQRAATTRCCPATCSLPEAALARRAAPASSTGRANACACSAPTRPPTPIREYEQLRRRRRQLDDAQRYGLALARAAAATRPRPRRPTWRALLEQHPDDTVARHSRWAKPKPAPARRPRPTRASRRCSTACRTTARSR